MDPILDMLNPEQLKAVIAEDKMILVLAGPGSGKTKTLSHRIARLIRDGVRTNEILAVTFTNKASKEMKKRIIDLVGDPMSQSWIGTFHSVCLRMLVLYGQAVGLRPGFTIIDDKDQTKLVKQAIKDIGIDIDERPDSILSRISFFKNTLVTPQMAMEAKPNDQTGHIYQRYQELLHENNALDFDELQTKAIQLLETHTPTRNHYHQKFRYIFIDEYQDINDAQYRLVQLLRHQDVNVFAVGDDAQSIYRFRSANIKHILNMQREPGINIIKLERNYRSTKKIVQTANAIMKGNSSQISKELWTSNDEGLNIIHYHASDEIDEAEHVAALIRRTMEVEPDRKLSDFTVLYRTNSQSRAFEEVFMTKNIAYQIIGGVSFFQRKEVKDMVAYLRIITNKYDSLALERVINVPKRGIGDTTIGKIVQFSTDKGISFPEGVSRIREVPKISAKTVVAIEEFNKLITTLRVYIQRPGTSISDVIDYIWDHTQYVELLLKDGSEDSMIRIGNLDEFYNMADRYEKSNPDGDVEGFLNSISLFTDQDSIKDTEDMAKLMTAHASKGLEFPIVFVTGMEEGIFPHFRALYDEQELEEERRLYYVAITRSKEKVYLSSSRYRTMRGEAVLQTISRFINEIPSHLITKK